MALRSTPLFALLALALASLGCAHTTRAGGDAVLGLSLERREVAGRQLLVAAERERSSPALALLAELVEAWAALGDEREAPPVGGSFLLLQGRGDATARLVHDGLVRPFPKAPREAAFASAVARALIEEELSKVVRAEGEGSAAWFVEGASRVLARRLLFHMGLLDAEQYAAELDWTFERYLLGERAEARPTMAQQLARPAAEANSSPPASPESAGELLALLMDHASMAGRLEGLVRGVRGEARLKGRALTEAELLALVERLSRPGTVDELWAIQQGGAVAIPKDIFAPCLRFTSVMKGPFDLGFELAASLKARRAIGVRHGSRAWLAGLREGQGLYDVRLEAGAGEQVELLVSDGGVRRDIFYTPIDARFVAPVFTVFEPSACRELL